MYFPERDLQSIIRLVESFEQFGKPVQITEIGTTSGGGDYEPEHDLYEWRRPWDEDLQADWLEELYTLFYSKPWIEAGQKRHVGTMLLGCRQPEALEFVAEQVL